MTSETYEDLVRQVELKARLILVEADYFEAVKRTPPEEIAMLRKLAAEYLALVPH